MHSAAPRKQPEVAESRRMATSYLISDKQSASDHRVPPAWCFHCGGWAVLVANANPGLNPPISAYHRAICGFCGSTDLPADAADSSGFTRGLCRFYQRILGCPNRRFFPGVRPEGLTEREVRLWAWCILNSLTGRGILVGGNRC